MRTVELSNSLMRTVELKAAHLNARQDPYTQ